MTVPDFLEMVRNLERGIQNAGLDGKKQPPKILDWGLANSEYQKYVDKEEKNQEIKKTDFKKIIEVSHMSLPSYRKRLMGEKKLYHALQSHHYMIEDSVTTSKS